MSRKLLSLFLICSVLILLTGTYIIGAKEKRAKQTAKKPEVVGIVDYVIGKALIKKAGTKIWKPLKLKTKLTKGDEIKTLAKSRVKIRLKNKKIAEIKPKSKVKIASLLKKSKKVKGSLKSIFSKTKKGTEFGVTGVAGVRGADVSKKNEK